MRMLITLPFCLRVAVAFAPSTCLELAARLHASDADDAGSVSDDAGDELDWDAEFANLQRS